MTKKIVAIWAQDETGLIGKDQTLPWHLPAELKHFKEVTTGHAILMGRVTFDGMQGRVLPNRLSLILTRDKSYQVDDERVLVFHDLDSVLSWYQEQERTLFIIGGGQVFSAFEDLADQLILTQIHAQLEGDTYFPKDFDFSRFEETSSLFHAKDEKNQYDFTVKVLERKDS
ncbi:dihydrofolate reductase [Streptococcus oricebi]|uniref:Dihydrofolate reductase n=1 Tax=Streptococcus oricebi TaxID=1547447 RepID=A0ABS5B5C3_9STRE|nr:dihydrofolate reductase [Streptococcus oricebi]MBP2623179.1 dihydrofolate reductase [Streptococcus oricebi]